MFRQGKHRDKIKSSTVDSEPEIMKPLCSEVIKLKEGKMENQSAYVKPFKGPVPQKKVLMFRVRRVANPFEIILEVVMDIKDIDYHEWFPKMQEHYTEFEDNMRMDIDALTLGNCYAYKHPKKKQWHRVRVYDIDKERKTVTIFFIDWCLTKSTQYHEDSFASLTHYFAGFDSPLFRCYLEDVEPLFRGWSKQASKYCEESLFVKSPKHLYKGIILSQSESFIYNGFPDVVQNAGVVLIPKGQRDSPCTINATLVKQGMAKAKGIFACCPHSLKAPGLLNPEFDLIEYYTLFPKDVLTNRQKRHTTGGKPLGCIVSEEDSKSVHKQDEPLPVLFDIAVCKIKILFVDSPTSLYIQKVSELGMLHDLEMATDVAAENMPYDPEQTYQPGEFVAACYVDIEKNLEKTWRRGVVLGLNKDKYCVLLIDHGADISVRRSQLRSLPPYFIPIQTFVYRVHLELPWCIPAITANWSFDASDAFRSHIFIEEAAGKQFYLDIPPNASQISLISQNQDLVYLESRQRWIADPTFVAEDVARILKLYPQLSNLFLSQGVNISVGKPNSGVFWQFSSIAECLLSDSDFACEKAASTQIVNEKEVFHDKLFSMRSCIKPARRNRSQFNI